jgi:hypothetical protein
MIYWPNASHYHLVTQYNTISTEIPLFQFAINIRSLLLEVELTFFKKLSNYIENILE